MHGSRVTAHGGRSKTRLVLEPSPLKNGFIVFLHAKNYVGAFFAPQKTGFRRSRKCPNRGDILPLFA
jgi:hypothetical protein